jgi:uncharacterized protein YraI
MSKLQSLATAIIAVLAAPSAAFAETTANATADLNIRAGPGPQFPIVGVINAGEATMVTGCLQGSKWCTVSHSGAQGWAYSDYLTAGKSAPHKPSGGTDRIYVREVIRRTSKKIL